MDHGGVSHDGIGGGGADRGIGRDSDPCVFTGGCRFHGRGCCGISCEPLWEEDTEVFDRGAGCGRLYL